MVMRPVPEISVSGSFQVVALTVIAPVSAVLPTVKEPAVISPNIPLVMLSVLPVPSTAMVVPAVRG